MILTSGSRFPSRDNHRAAHYALPTICLHNCSNAGIHEGLAQSCGGTLCIWTYSSSVASQSRS